MKKITAGLTALMILAPTIASATTYMCSKRHAEIYGTACPAGSSWDSSYHACIVHGS